MSQIRRMLPSANALFFFEAVARTGSFTRAASELNVTQPAVSRMMSRLEAHLGVRLFERSAGGAMLTEEGALLHRPVASSFRAIEDGLASLEARRSGVEPVTLSVSSAFTTHWLIPRIATLKQLFPAVDLRFQLIAGSLQGPVDTVDLGMRFRGDDAPESELTALLMREVVLPVCSPAYLAAREESGAITTIDLADTVIDWPARFDDLHARSGGAFETLRFSDYAVVVQAALLGQGVAPGWMTVACHWLAAGTLVPASARLMTTRRICEFVLPRGRPVRPVVIALRDWIVEEMRGDVAAIDRAFPELGLYRAAYGRDAG